MTMSDADLERIKSNWETFEGLCKRLSDQGVNSLLDELGDRLVMCPAAPNESQCGAYPGGLIEHALKVTSNMRTMAKAFDVEVQTASILKVGLLHDIGKVGDLEQNYFIEQDSDWHREKLGQVYKFNEGLNKMSVSHRTLFLLQRFGIKLSKEEWIAIQLAAGSHFEENRFYVGHEPTLALILQLAKRFTVHADNNS